MTTQSETPRTDAMSVVGYGEGGFESSYGFRCVPIEDARQLERELAAMTEQLAEARTIAWDWGQGVDDAETAIRKLSRMFPIDTMKEPK